MGSRLTGGGRVGRENWGGTLHYSRPARFRLAPVRRTAVGVTPCPRLRPGAKQIPSVPPANAIHRARLLKAVTRFGRSKEPGHAHSPTRRGQGRGTEVPAVPAPGRPFDERGDP